jgi:hypothetical protein
VADQEEIAFSPSSDFWFRRRAEGQDVAVHNMLLGTSGPTGEPRFSYYVSTKQLCYPGWNSLREETDATIWFNDVPGFACITQEQLKALLPGAKRHFATDGAIPYSYSGKARKNIGTSVEFL